MIDPYIPERGNWGYEVRHHQLVLDYSIASNRLEGTARLHVLATEQLDRLALDLVHLQVISTSVDGRAARWRRTPGKVVITPARPIDAGRAVVVEVRYRGNPRPAPSRWGPLGWEELTDGVLVASQPSGAPTWFPCNDVAAHKASFDITFTTASTHRVLINGARRADRRRGSTTTWQYVQSEPTSPYLMAVHVGRYDERTIVDGPVPIRAVVPAELWSQYDRAFARLPAMMDLFVERFGPYPFADGYSVVVCPEPLDVPVEAQGQAAFGTNHLDGHHERLIAHELAHQWFGNSVTASTWRDIWLHEGFCAYAEWLWSEASGGRSAEALARSHRRLLQGLPQDLVIGEPGPDQMFDDRVYKRGALALHALRGALGDVAFFDALRSWTATHAHGVVATDDLFELTGAGAVLRPWLYEAALP